MGVAGTGADGGGVPAEEEFERFVQAVSPRLLRAAWLLVGSWSGAEDLVQTAFERLWPKWQKLDDDARRAAYVHQILTRAFLRGRRRKWTGEIATGELPAVAVDGTDDLVRRHTVLAAVGRLPRKQRTVIALRYLADLTEAQTAVALRCAPGTVKSATSRALAALRADPRLTGVYSEGSRS